MLVPRTIADGWVPPSVPSATSAASPRHHRRRRRRGRRAGLAASFVVSLVLSALGLAGWASELHEPVVDAVRAPGSLATPAAPPTEAPIAVDVARASATGALAEPDAQNFFPADAGVVDVDAGLARSPAVPARESEPARARPKPVTPTPSRPSAKPPAVRARAEATPGTARGETRHVPGAVASRGPVPTAQPGAPVPPAAGGPVAGGGIAGTAATPSPGPGAPVPSASLPSGSPGSPSGAGPSEAPPAPAAPSASPWPPAQPSHTQEPTYTPKPSYTPPRPSPDPVPERSVWWLLRRYPSVASARDAARAGEITPNERNLVIAELREARQRERGRAIRRFREGYIGRGELRDRLREIDRRYEGAFEQYPPAGIHIWP
jgi:hypothetical protein